MKTAIVLLASVLGAVLAQAATRDLASMYDPSQVAREQARLRSRVQEVYEKAFRPNLLPEEQRALAGLTIEAPLSGDPVIGYYSNYRTKVVTMPAVSLLFFEDLCTAYAWLWANGYRLETVEEYVTMLKYKDAAGFGGRYLPPLRALQIPTNALDNPKVNDLSLRFRNTGYAFILGHELGHIRYQHPGYKQVPVAVSQANEEQADQFGLELMRRVSEIPMGAMIFFQSAIYYFENRSDFNSDQQWQDYLQNVATHPLSAHRLKAMATRLSEAAPDFARGQPNRNSAIETVTFIGSGFKEFAEFLDDPTLQRVMRAKAEKSGISSLAPRRDRESVADFPIK
jgi:hypothetical protein